jgi:hypothetical protein
VIREPRPGPSGVGLGVLLGTVLISCGSSASIHAGSDLTHGDVSIPQSGTYQYSLTIASGDADPGVLRLSNGTRPTSRSSLPAMDRFSFRRVRGSGTLAPS